MKHTARPFLVSFLVLLAALLLSAAVGSVAVSPAEWRTLLKAVLDGRAFSDPQTAPLASIFFNLRLPRTFLVALAGAALAGSGSAYQGLFRNPLADPYLIGVASGAGLGAVLAMSIRFPYTLGGLLATPAAAFVGALISVFLVMQLGRAGKGIAAPNLVLAGVAVSAFASALTSFLMLRATGELRRALVWLLGGSTLSGWLPVLAALPYILVGLGVLTSLGHGLNVLQFGSEQAQQLGLPVRRVRFLVIASATLATAAAVAFTGVIGFVGLIMPHLARLLWGSDYRRLIPLSTLGGAVLLLLADVVARVILAPQELPVGIITALLGAPFFLWVLRRSQAAEGS